MHVDVQVQAERQVRTDYCAVLAGGEHVEGRTPLPPPPYRRPVTVIAIGELTLAEGDSARERAGIVVDPVVGDLQVVVPAVDEDAAAALGAVPDGEAVNRRRIALKVAGIGVGNEFSRCSRIVQ